MRSWILLFAALCPQDDPHLCPTQPPAQSKIDEAVERGVKFLRAEMGKSDLTLDAHGGHSLDELLLAALVYGGLPEEHEDVRRLLRPLLERSLSKTYEAVLLAVTLDKLDNEYYLWKLVEIGQFLLDNECENGQWSYANPTELPTKTKKLIQELKEWGEQRRKQRAKGKGSTKVPLKIDLSPQRFRSREGDNSNTQFAALGLRICADAGIRFPRERVELARHWWLTQQTQDGGWRYSERDKEEPYLAMGAGGVSSLLALQCVLEKDLPPKSKDPKAAVVQRAVDKGLQWLEKNFTFHPARGVFMKEPYTHYSIERVGILSTLEKIGPHPWYAEGAYDLLDHQRKDGSWRLTHPRRQADPKEVEAAARNWAMIDTALAILFFRKSVRPPVATKPTGP